MVSVLSKVTGLNRPFPRKATVDNPILSSSPALRGQMKLIHSCMNSAKRGQGLYRLISSFHTSLLLNFKGHTIALNT